jgi:hypothetical protein
MAIHPRSSERGILAFSRKVRWFGGGEGDTQVWIGWEKCEWTY